MTTQQSTTQTKHSEPVITTQQSTTQTKHSEPVITTQQPTTQTKQNDRVLSTQQPTTQTKHSETVITTQQPTTQTKQNDRVLSTQQPTTQTKHSEFTKTKPSYYRDGKKTLTFTRYKGEKMDTCATIHDDYVCCNVKVLKSVSNCPFDCSYCFLQNYLTDPQLNVVNDISALTAEVKQKIEAQPWRFFRIGTWELGDSLALEADTGQAKSLIEFFSTCDNAVLELKTKSDCVDTILNIKHRQKTVVSWSMNTEHIIRTEEHKTASLAQRLAAIKKVVDANYLVGLHFDPMIWTEHW